MIQGAVSSTKLTDQSQIQPLTHSKRPHWDNPFLFLVDTGWLLAQMSARTEPNQTHLARPISVAIRLWPPHQLFGQPRDILWHPNLHPRHPVEVQGGLFEQVIAQRLKHDWSDATLSSTFIKRCFDAAKHPYIGRDSQDGTLICSQQPAPSAVWTAPHRVSCHK